MFANHTQIPMKPANMEFHPTLNKKLFTDEPNMFANHTQIPMKPANMEFHPTLNKKKYLRMNRTCLRIIHKYQ